ncbi:tRNA 2-thiouridine(34) synthase MnmA [bacterium]
MKNTVAVAMSGGVDSSVSAFLLKQDGYNVIGISMLMPYQDEDQRHAFIQNVNSVSLCLDIPIHFIDIKDEFEDKVVSYFCSEYSNGRTPNPCIVCNKSIKFGVLLNIAKELACGCIATGHYANVEYNQEKDRFILKKGIDAKKDQSYFLFSLSQEQLSHVIFPLGKYTKQDVREIAEKNNIPVFNNKESQEICFIPDNDYIKFLEDKHINKGFNNGNIVYKDGTKAGIHNGIAKYTIGQRKGIGAHQKKHYVVRINSADNTIIIDEEQGLMSDECVVSVQNMIVQEELKSETKLKARIRYRHNEDNAKIIPINDKKVKVIFDKPQRAITPGQSMVFYDGDIVAGGGVIDY